MPKPKPHAIPSRAKDGQTAARFYNYPKNASPASAKSSPKMMKTATPRTKTVSPYSSRVATADTTKLGQRPTAAPPTKRTTYSTPTHVPTGRRIAGTRTSEPLSAVNIRRANVANSANKRRRTK